MAIVTTHATLNRITKCAFKNQSKAFLCTSFNSGKVMTNNRIISILLEEIMKTFSQDFQSLHYD